MEHRPRGRTGASVSKLCRAFTVTVVATTRKRHRIVIVHRYPGCTG